MSDQQQRESSRLTVWTDEEPRWRTSGTRCTEEGEDEGASKLTPYVDFVDEQGPVCNRVELFNSHLMVLPATLVYHGEEARANPGSVVDLEGSDSPLPSARRRHDALTSGTPGSVEPL